MPSAISITLEMSCRVGTSRADMKSASMVMMGVNACRSGREPCQTCNIRQEFRCWARPISITLGMRRRIGTCTADMISASMVMMGVNAYRSGQGPCQSLTQTYQHPAGRDCRVRTFRADMKSASMVMMGVNACRSDREPCQTQRHCAGDQLPRPEPLLTSWAADC